MCPLSKGYLHMTSLSGSVPKSGSADRDGERGRPAVIGSTRPASIDENRVGGFVSELSNTRDDASRGRSTCNLTHIRL